MLEKAIKWIKNNTLHGEGIVVSSEKRYHYPEVTGYLIPTLLSIGERELACEYAKWLVDIQKPDGSFSAPGSSVSYVFDTGQVLRGWINIVHYLPQLENSINKACNWIVANSSSEGRLFLPESPGAWSLGERGFINEGVHLYVLPPLLKAGEIFNKPNYIKFVRKSLNYYKDINLTDFNKPNALTHFFCYIQEALVDLGEIELAHNGMNSLVAFQQENGALPAFSDVKWVCTPGQIQAAIVWYKLGEYERADRALTFIEQFMNPSGGFFGSYGVEANYFPSEEISWATKFYIDAYLLRIERFFDKEHSIFSETIESNDGRLNTILNYAGNLNGYNVLDVGCGKGRFANAIKRVYPKVNLYGLDISEELLKSVPPNIKTFKGSMLNIPFKDNFFDVAYCVEALEHAVRVEQAIIEMCRVLKPGGQLIIIDKNAEKWGSMKTPQWEQWFSPEGLTDLIKKYCNEVKWEFISYDQQKIPDGIFVAWVGRKIESGMLYYSADFIEHSTFMLPENKKYQPLIKEEWHKAIIGGANPSEVAERISKRQVPEWIKPLIDNTKEGDLVIELGSGTGEISAYLSYQGRKVILVDYSQNSLDFSKEVFKHLGLSGEFVLADVTKKLPFPDNYADLVWSSGLLEHFCDDEIVRILKESKRISRRAVLSLVPNANSIPYRLGKWLQEQTGEWKWGYEDPKFSMVNFFEEAGLYDINEYSIAVMHSLNFLSLAEFAPVKNKLQAFFENLPSQELQQLNQGYLLVTKGYAYPFSSQLIPKVNRKTRRLAVLPGDPLEAYEKAGYSNWLQDYYNPCGYFDEVYCLSPFENKERFAYGMQIIPTTPEQFREHIKKFKIDIIRAYGGSLPSDIVCNNKVAGIPTVVSLHDTNPEYLHESIKKADYIFTVSNIIKEIIINKGVDPKKVKVLPNRVDLNAFYPYQDNSLKAEFEKIYPGKYRILHVGRKSVQKNLDTLIHALVHLGKKYVCIFIGRGDDLSFRSLAEQCGVKDQCYFIESVPNTELAKYYSFCHCMCTPSRWEGFGIVFIEALACESVVVTSDISPMNEYIQHNINGILVKDYENPIELANNVRRACIDGKLRAKIKSNARRSIEMFSKEIVDKMERDFYEGILLEKNEL